MRVALGRVHIEDLQAANSESCVRPDVGFLKRIMKKIPRGGGGTLGSTSYIQVLSLYEK